MNTDGGQLSDEEMVELAAFADGSMTPEDRERVAKKVAGSPELRAALDRQLRTIRASADVDAAAPPDLHARILASLPLEDEPEPVSSRRWFQGVFRMPSLRLAGGFAVALLAVAIGIVALTGSTSPSVDQTAELASLGATSQAPAVNVADPDSLDASVGEVAFPNYEDSFGWIQSGQRSDEVEGRGSKTVFYRREGKEIAYSILEGDPLEWPDGATFTKLDGVEYYPSRYEGRNVVAWLREGHTCVISSSEVSRADLVRLAASEGGGSTA